MNCGMIIKIGITRSIVMNDAMELVSIRKKPGMVEGMRIYYLEGDLVKGNVGHPIYWLRYAAIAAMLVLMVLTVQFAQRPTPLVPNTFAIVTMDINPSVELDINSGGKVMDVRALNNDGASLLIGNFETLSVEEALERLLKMAKAQGYLADSGAVLLASTQGQKISENAFDVTDVLTDFIMRHNSEYTFMYYEGDENELAMAREQSLSLGRYKLNHLIDDDLLDDASVNGMPISEITKNRDVMELLQQAQNKGEVKMFRAGAVLKEEAPLGEGLQTRAESGFREGYNHQNQFQIENQEKDGGGGQNSDNGQQQNGNVGTNGKGNNNGAGKGQQGTNVEAPKGTTDAALEVNIVVETPAQGNGEVDSNNQEPNGEGNKGETGGGTSGGTGGQSGGKGGKGGK